MLSSGSLSIIASTGRKDGGASLATVDSTGCVSTTGIGTLQILATIENKMGRRSVPRLQEMK